MSKNQGLKRVSARRVFWSSLFYRSMLGLFMLGVFSLLIGLLVNFSSVRAETLRKQAVAQEGVSHEEKKFDDTLMNEDGAEQHESQAVWPIFLAIFAGGIGAFVLMFCVRRAVGYYQQIDADEIGRDNAGNRMLPGEWYIRPESVRVTCANTFPVSSEDRHGAHGIVFGYTYTADANSPAFLNWLQQTEGTIWEFMHMKLEELATCLSSEQANREASKMKESAQAAFAKLAEEIAAQGIHVSMKSLTYNQLLFGTLN